MRNKIPRLLEHNVPKNNSILVIEHELDPKTTMKLIYSIVSVLIFLTACSNSDKSTKDSSNDIDEVTESVIEDHMNEPAEDYIDEPVEEEWIETAAEEEPAEEEPTSNKPDTTEEAKTWDVVINTSPTATLLFVTIPDLLAKIGKISCT